MPHRMLIVSGTPVHMLDDYEFAFFFGVTKLFLEPEHLLHTRPSRISASSFTVVVERIQR